VNILFLDQFSDPGGAQLALLDLMGEVLRRRWKPRIMAPGFGPLLKRASFAGIPVQPLSLRSLSSGHKSVTDLFHYMQDLPVVKQEIARAIDDHHIDLIYANGPRILPATVGLELPVIFHAHSYVNGFFPRRLAMHAVHAANATVIAASRFAGSQFQPVSRNPVHVVYNGAPDLKSSMASAKPEKLRIGLVGRLAPEKGQMDFVRAAAVIGGDSTSFTIYGQTFFSTNDYELRVRELAARSPVRFEPWQDDPAGVYREIDILAVPSSRFEASTRVIMEAFSAGVTVVAYPSGGIPEIVEHGRTGLLTESNAYQSLASAIQRLRNNPGLRAQLAVAGRGEWERRFTKQRFQTAICDIIAGVMQRHRSATSSLDPAAQSATTAEYLRDKTPPAAPVRR